jgi:hypothetical protein
MALEVWEEVGGDRRIESGLVRLHAFRCIEVTDQPATCQSEAAPPAAKPHQRALHTRIRPIQGLQLEILLRDTTSPSTSITSPQK